jgi:hypothetical protein
MWGAGITAHMPLNGQTFAARPSRVLYAGRSVASLDWPLNTPLTPPTSKPAGRAGGFFRLGWGLVARGAGVGLYGLLNGLSCGSGASWVAPRWCPTHLPVGNAVPAWWLGWLFAAVAQAEFAETLRPVERQRDTTHTG